ncbi:MAG: glycosyltransferase [Nitrospirae bacterium]|nr:glycosyltransferase [Nitrospirota bacterium]
MEPLLAGIAVNWHGDEEILRLVESWPKDSRFELLVVDNSGSLGDSLSGTQVLEPSRNLGFGGAVNAALERTRAPSILILNSDARPTPGALESLIEGLEIHSEAAGLAPRLLSADGSAQHRWQLRPLPSPLTLLLQSLMIPAGQGSKLEPTAGTLVEQPAAAALALRRSALEEIGGFDEDFFPAWFEDVDLARRLFDSDRQMVYWPAATFEHLLGATVPRLGYGRFLWIYYRNLGRYLRKHHSQGMALLARALTAAAATVRIPLLVVRKPSRASSRREALSGLTGLLLGTLSGWRLPHAQSRAVGDDLDTEAPGG